jgi:mannitol/fructose-specific phosphotransferase system IIA component (Ntr-type)
MFSQFLYEDQIYLDLKAKNSFGCFLEMLRRLEDLKKIKDKAPILTALMTREELEPTNIGSSKVRTGDRLLLP